MKNSVRADFNLPSILSMNMKETEMYDRNYLSIYHSSISSTKDVKWITKTYIFENNDDNLMTRFSYITYFDDNKKILSSANNVTQIFFSRNIINTNKKFSLYPKNYNNELKSIVLDGMVLYTNKDINDSDIKSDLFRIVKYFVDKNIDFNIVVENDKLNIYTLEQNNFLFLNLINKFNEEKFINDLIKIEEIIQILN